jgi:hypothetical protein
MSLGGFKQNQKGMKLNGTHHLLVYTHAINILGGSIHTIKKNTEALAVCSNETGLEVNAEKMKYMFMS